VFYGEMKKESTKCGTFWKIEAPLPADHERNE